MLIDSGAEDPLFVMHIFLIVCIHNDVVDSIFAGDMMDSLWLKEGHDRLPVSVTLAQCIA